MTSRLFALLIALCLLCCAFALPAMAADGGAEDSAAPSVYAVDTTPPVLKGLTLSGTEIKAPGSITVTMTATDDNSGVDGASAYFYCEENDKSISCYISKESDGKFRGTLSVGEYQASGVYKLASVYIYDDAGNSVNYCREPIFRMKSSCLLP